jgi:hypothetical protein
MGLEIARKWRPVAAWWSVMCLMAACGGGDGGTGPGGGEITGDYRLMGVNDAALPAPFTSNICPPAQFINGSMTLSANGTFQMAVSYVNEQNAPDGFQDHGRFQQHDDQLVFVSEAWGDQFEGELDGRVVVAHYDFCNDNQGADLDLAFAH